MTAARRPLRIAILSSSLAGGGAERCTLGIAAELIRRGHEVDLVLKRLLCDYPGEAPSGLRLLYLMEPDTADADAVHRALPVVPEPLVPVPYPFRVRFPRLSLAPALFWRQLPSLSASNSPQWAAAIAAYLDRERPDALLAMQLPSVVAASVAARAARRRLKIVGTMNSALSTNPPHYLHRARRSYPFLDAAVGVSRGIADELTEAVGVPPDRVHTIHDPVVSANLVPDSRRPAGHDWLDKPGPPVILAAGTLKESKDFSTLLAAFAKLVAQRAARLVLLGKGPLRSRLCAEAEALGCAEHVDLPGFVQNIYAFMAKASLFAFSSRNEGLSAVLIQALACGCPVVSTDCPFGPADILEDGRWGELVPVGDAKALSEAMARALDRPPPREALRKRASAFGIDPAVTRYEELLMSARTRTRRIRSEA